MKLIIYLCTVFSMTSINPAFSATILSVKKVNITGAHGMTVVSDNKIILADTFKSKDSSLSRLYELSENKVSQIDFKGVGLSGITNLKTGYLICDLHDSVVYKTNKKFEVENKWQVKNPWIAKKDVDGNIFVLTYSGQFLSLNLNGFSEVLIANLDVPFDFEFEPRGIWISEQGKHHGRVSLWKFDQDKKLHRVIDSNFNWKNPEGLLKYRGYLWVLDTELGQLIQVKNDGATKVALKDLGTPILIQRMDRNLLIYTNNYKGSPALLQVHP